MPGAVGADEVAFSEMNSKKLPTCAYRTDIEEWWQTGGPEFKSQYHQKKKRKKRGGEREREKLVPYKLQLD
jgi:hypothetical protein